MYAIKQHIPQPGRHMPFRLGDAFCARRVLLLVFVDLDIAGRVFILNKQQRGGQGNGQRGEQCEQHFENFHGLKPPWKSLARSGDVPQVNVDNSIPYFVCKGKHRMLEEKYGG